MTRKAKNQQNQNSNPIESNPRRHSKARKPCSATGKIKFNSEADALLFMEEYNRVPKGKKGPLRNVYKCKGSDSKASCGYYHVTTVPRHGGRDGRINLESIPDGPSKDSLKARLLREMYEQAEEMLRERRSENS